MEITEVRIKLMEEPGERLKAFCSITFDDCFVVRDLKIIEGSNGPFVAMPSRKLTSHCHKCGSKNHLRASYCNQCGAKLEEGRAPKDADGRAKLYADIAHPINSGCREMIQDRVIQDFHKEIELAKQPGYISRYDDFDVDFPDESHAKTARFDKPHPQPGSRPAHIAPKPAQEQTAVHRPHDAQPPATSETSPSPGNDNPSAGSFGAGIFPKKS